MSKRTRESMILESLTLNESKINYDPFKKDMKIDDKNGRWTDGWGHRYTKKNHKSDKIRYKNYDFIYDYDKESLSMYDGNKLIDSAPLSIGNWLDGIEYWLDKFYDEVWRYY